tara:strand:+ start:277 stop:717 length:441 start_codon:yes stop_codon:yes gene_type:complete
MFKLFSESTQYAIQAMIHLACNLDKKTNVNIIAEKEGIPSQYLGKIVQVLSKHNLIKATRGRGGGISLNYSPKDIKIIDIVIAINGPFKNPEMCVYGLDFCVDTAPCPVHKQWKGLKEDMKIKLMDQNLLSLSNNLKEKHKSMVRE